MSDQEDDWNATYYVDELSDENIADQYNRIVERIESEINVQEKKKPNFLLFVLVHGHNGTGNDLNVIKSELYNQFQNSILVLSSSSNSFSTHGGIEVAGKNLACEIVQFLTQVNLIGAKSFAKQKYSRWKLSAISDKENENSILFTQTSDECDAKKETILFNGLHMLSSGENASQFSVVFIGHGSGGLYIRNCIGWLFEFGYFQSDEEEESTTSKVISSPLFPLALYTISTPHLGLGEILSEIPTETLFINPNSSSNR